MIRIYNCQHLKSHSIGNTLYLNYLNDITAIQLPIRIACVQA